MKKIIMPILCAAMLILSLTGCGGSQAQLASPTVLPTPTTGSVISSFTGKVTAKKGNTFTVDMQNGTVNSSTIGDTDKTAASPSPAPTYSVPGTTKGVPVVVPTNAVVTLLNGNTGTISDVKVGSLATFKMTNSVVTAISIVSSK